MFYNCNALPSIDVTNFSTLNTSNMRGMFERCASFESLDLSSFIYQGTGSIQTKEMFSACGAKILDIRNFYVFYEKMSDSVSDMLGSSATEVILGHAGTGSDFAAAVLAACEDKHPAPDGYHWEIFNSSERGTVVAITMDLT